MITTNEWTKESNNGWVFLLEGMAGIIIGLILLPALRTAPSHLATSVGFYCLVASLLALARVFVDRSVPWIWSLLTGIVGLLPVIYVLYFTLKYSDFGVLDVAILSTLLLPRGLLEIIGGFTGRGIDSFIRGMSNILMAVLVFVFAFSVFSMQNEPDREIVYMVEAPALGALLLVQGLVFTILALRVRHANS